MKKNLLSLSLMMTAAVILMFSSCKKNDDNDDSVSAEDNSVVSSSLNSSMDDVSDVAGNIESLSGKTEGFRHLCGADVDTTQKANGIITINYIGTGCLNGISRTGSVTLTLENYASGIRWKDAGAVLDIVFNNVVVTNTIKGGSFTLNGTHTLTNVTGGLAWRIMDGLDEGTVKHHHTATDFTLTWADGSVRTWSVDRYREFKNEGGVRTVTVSSDHTEDGTANADAWGTNRRGDAFVSAIVTPISSNSTCGWHKPTQGLVTHKVGGRAVEILFGVDASGNPITTGGCAYGFKITFTKLNRTKTKIVSYWF